MIITKMRIDSNTQYIVKFFSTEWNGCTKIEQCCLPRMIKREYSSNVTNLVKWWENT